MASFSGLTDITAEAQRRDGNIGFGCVRRPAKGVQAASAQICEKKQLKLKNWPFSAILYATMNVEGCQPLGLAQGDKLEDFDGGCHRG